jgi:Tfp pilus assembly protein PilN
MSPLVWIGIVWGIVTAILIILLIYRSTLTMHEDDQLFLDESESHMEQEQIQLMKRVDQISPYLKVLGALSGAMILVMAGMAVYQGLNQPQ